MAITLVPDAPPTTLLRSFIGGMGETAKTEDLARLRIGTPLSLRRAARPRHGCTIEIMAVGGGALGWLPREDEEVLIASGADLKTTAARIIGIVPAFQRPRIQIEVELPAIDQVVEPAA